VSKDARSIAEVGSLPAVFHGGGFGELAGVGAGPGLGAAHTLRQDSGWLASLVGACFLGGCVMAVGRAPPAVWLEKRQRHGQPFETARLPPKIPANGPLAALPVGDNLTGEKLACL